MKVGSTLEHMGTGDHFLNITPATQTLIAMINTLDLPKLRSFHNTEELFNKIAAYRVGKDLS